jgi:hypothetical protein
MDSPNTTHLSETERVVLKGALVMNPRTLPERDSATLELAFEISRRGDASFVSTTPSTAADVEDDLSDEEGEHVGTSCGGGSLNASMIRQFRQLEFPHPNRHGLTQEEYKHRLADSVVLDYIFKNWEALGLFMFDNDKLLRRRQRQAKESFWNTSWGKRILLPETADVGSRMGKLFRRRFRLPFPVFVRFVEQCREYNIFDLKYKSSLPIEVKVLACLRILGRDHSADDCNDACDAIGVSTINTVFKKFVKNVFERLYPLWVKFPSGQYLDQVMKAYSLLGLPGCVGSFDCTHVKWSMCPAVHRWYATGKSSFYIHA